jgi:hypothetical protein
VQPTISQSSRFKTALKDSYTLLQNGLQAGVIPAAVPVNVAQLATDTLVKLNPVITIPKWTLSNILLPAHILKLIGEKFVEAMAYPEFDIPRCTNRWSTNPPSCLCRI